MASYLTPQLPPIAITTHDMERLSRLAELATGRFPVIADFLAREIERADVIADVEVLPGLVTMGSEVEFRDDISGRVRSLTLVYPDDIADVESGTISVLTPIGAALIGLSVSQSIEFQTPSGGWRSLTVMGVKPPRRQG